MGATLRVYGGLNQPDNLGITEQRVAQLDQTDPDEVD